MARTKRSIDHDEDGERASGPIDVTVHRWAREPWRGKLQTILSGLDIDSLDESTRLYLQRHLYIAKRRRGRQRRQDNSRSLHRDEGSKLGAAIRKCLMARIVVLGYITGVGAFDGSL
jgi:hypothetical protein